MCGFVTPLQGPEADEHRKPEVWAAGWGLCWSVWGLGKGRGQCCPSH